MKPYAREGETGRCTWISESGKANGLRQGGADSGKVSAQCQFHGIGQGLFYSARVSAGERTFFFVYDCGTDCAKDKKRLEREIASCFSPPEKGGPPAIDALFLSHLDRDHISGVPCLLKKFKVKDVFLPYFTREERYLLALKEEPEDEELLPLYEDPEGYFLANGCRGVYVLGPARRGPASDDLGEHARGTQNESFELRGDLTRPLGPGKNAEPIFRCWGAAELKLYTCPWRFGIYQDQSEEEQERIRKQIRALLPAGKGLADLLLDAALCREAKELYRTVKYGINQSSLVLYHAPAQGKGILRYCADGDYCCCSSDMTGTLLTGDLDLNRLRENGEHLFDFAVHREGRRLGVFQLPHHGSGRSICVDRVEKAVCPHGTVLVCSYGRNNRYRHPDAYALNKLALRCRCPVIHVVEGEGFCYTIEMT